MRRREALKVLGAGVTLPVLGGITGRDLAALGAEIRAGAAPKPVAGQLGYLDAHQNATVTAVADLILPRTDTPGAADVGVNEFIDRIVGSWYGGRERGDFLVGLMRIDEMARDRNGRDFVSLPREAQVALLGELEAESFALKEAQEAAAAAARGPGPYEFSIQDLPPAASDAPRAGLADEDETPWNEHIFQRLKYLTLYGYYTSRDGLIEEHHYRTVPGEARGCVPYEEVHGHTPLEPPGPSSAGDAVRSDTAGSAWGGHDA